MTLPERIEERVRKWPHWSRAERAKLDEILQGIIAHCASGNGSPWEARWCEANLKGIIGPGGSPAPQALEVSSELRDERGGSDACYDLCETLDVEEFLSRLGDILRAGDWGLTNAEGAVTLSIHITRAAVAVG